MIKIIERKGQEQCDRLSKERGQEHWFCCIRPKGHRGPHQTAYGKPRKRWAWVDTPV